jgi:hypothetical protein
MSHRVSLFVCAIVFMAGSAMATTFVVPDDAELIAKSAAIAIGTVEGSYVQETNGMIETVYEIRLESTLKGIPRKSELLRVVSPGGVLGDRGVYVASSPHFAQGDRVLLFLNRNRDRWETTDLTLGKFKFVTSTSGEPLLVRDMEDVVGWDRNGQTHHEKVRKEAGFLQFIQDRVHGRSATVAQSDYIVDASTVTLPPSDTGTRGTVQANGTIQANATAPFPGATYTDWVNNQPIRWPNISAGVTYFKRVDQNIPGAADGGVSVIQAGLAAWNNECGSNINLIYGGTTPTISQDFDTTHVVEFNDPQQRISGSWSGSGTIAIAFMSFSSTHTFDNTTWWSISDGDVVFQDGFPATHPAFGTAMTHELGHTIGWRHSNTDYATDGTCNPATQECTTAAIMNATVVSSYGFTLQPWDIHAAESVYPGGTCGTNCTPPTIAAQPQSATVTSGTSRTLTVTANGTTPFSYQWYTGASGNTASPIPGATSSSLTVTPTATTSYWVRVTNSCGSASSATATITVSVTPPPPPPPPASTGSVLLRADFNGDGRSDVLWFNPSTGQSSIWFMNGTATPPTVSVPSVPVGWAPVVTGDFNGDGKSDIFWRNASTGQTSVWLMNGATYMVTYATPTVPGPWTPPASADLDGNGRSDIIWHNPSTGQTSFWMFSGTGSFSTLTGPNAPNGYTLRATGDFNGDGRGDLFWHNTSTGQTLVWLMNGTGVSSSFAMFTPPTAWIVAGSVDFNGDLRSDILWFNTSTGQTSIWLMNGTASPTSLTGPTSAAGFVPAGLGDYNGNGTGDIFWRNPSTGQTRVWLMNSATLLSQFDTYTVPTSWRTAP